MSIIIPDPLPRFCIASNRKLGGA